MPGRTYCVTKCVEGRRPILDGPEAAEMIIGSLGFARRQGAIGLLAFVVMPDHYHALFVLMPGQDLAALMRRIGSYTANQFRRSLGVTGTVWQRDGFYDHACRKDEDAFELAEYIHHNPVRKGLVAVAEEWPYSSAHPSHRTMLDWGDWCGANSS